MSRKNFETRSIKLEQIDLWLNNPRAFQLFKDEAHCFEVFLKDKEFITLIKNVAKNGLGLATVVVSLADNQNRYVVKDGNRRVAALKLLHNPALCPPELSGKREDIQQLAAANLTNVLDRLDCAFSTDKNVIQQHLHLTHLGAQNGAGLVEWTELNKAKQAYETDTAEGCRDAYALINLAKSYGFKLEDPDFPISQLENFLLPSLLKTLDITIPKDQSQVKIGAEDKQGAIDVILKILEDIQDKKLSSADTPTGKPNVRDSARRREYLQETFMGAGFHEGKPQPANLPTTSRIVIPRGYVKAKRIYAELKNLNVSTTPLAYMLVLRLFLETTVMSALSALKQREKDTLKESIIACANELEDQKILSKDLHTSILLFAGKGVPLEESFFTLKSMHQVAHNPYFIGVKAEEAGIFWEALQPFIEVCWRHIRQHPTSEGAK